MSALRRLPLLVSQHFRPPAVALAPAVSRLLHSGTPDQRHGTGYSARHLFAVFGLGAAATATGHLTVAADAPATVEVVANPYARPAEARPLPASITLYQYEVCPYCCKVRAMLDYYKLPYSVVEVNPLTKGELGWSSYKKVPVVKLGDEVVADSSAIMSRLAVDVAAARPPAAAAAAAAASPSASTSGAAAAPAAKRSGWSVFGGAGGGDARGARDQGLAAAAAASSSAAAGADPAAEEMRWRKWVDERFVKVLTANIYRNWDESVESFRYITDQTSWGWGTRELARWGGAVMMWQVGKRMPKKYGIEGDLRAALYDAANDFVEHGLAGRRFAGGDAAPNLADLAAFGVLRAVRKTGAFRDLMEHSRLAPWFQAMEEAVGAAARLEA